MDACLRCRFVGASIFHWDEHEATWVEVFAVLEERSSRNNSRGRSSGISRQKPLSKTRIRVKEWGSYGGD